MENQFTINKKRVIYSAFFVPIAIPIIGLVVAIQANTYQNETFLEIFLGFALLGLLYGFFIWVPAVGMCMLAEQLFISERSTKKTVLLIFVGEGLTAWLVINSLLQFELTDLSYFPLAISIASAQGIRWFFLNRKGRIYTDQKLTLSDNTILDDTEIEK
jgi:hypothetical protein